MHSPCGGHVHVEHGVCNERIEEICFNQFKDPGKGCCIIRAVKVGTGLQHLEGNRTES